jgi:hypothetical protein
LTNEGEKMPNISGSFKGSTTSQTIVSLQDAPGHELNLAQINGVQKSPDANWNGAKLTYWGAADLVAGSGTQRGYFVNERADGDRDIGTFEGKITTAGGQVTLAGTYTHTGGTGKFSGLSGGGTYKGRAISPAELEMTWEGTYQLAGAKAQAR